MKKESTEIKDLKVSKIPKEKNNTDRTIPIKKTIKNIMKTVKKTTDKVTKVPRKPRIKKMKEEEPVRNPILTLSKIEENPILSPNPENGWEAWQTFNPGVVLINNKVHFVYRAIGNDGMSRCGYAESEDGFKVDYRSPNPVYEHNTKAGPYVFYSIMSGGSFGGCEDARLTKVKEDNRIYITYTACDNGLRVGMSSISVEDFVNRNWRWKKPMLISPPGRISKNWVIFPEKINGKYAIIHNIFPKIQIEYLDSLDFKEGEYIDSVFVGFDDRKFHKKRWDSILRGAGPPPIKTKEGWLLLYHAIDKQDPSKYKVGAMILDLNDPTKILYKANQPVIEPKEFYENSGAKPGVVYTTGAVVKDNKLLVYYGGADNYVCVCYTDIDKFLEEIKKGEKVELKTKKLKKK